MRWLTLGLLAAAIGCGGGAGIDSRPPTTGENLADLKEMLEELQSQKKKPPAKVADLRPQEPIHPMAVRQLTQGLVVYAWGTGLDAASPAVLAYPKEAAEKGGPVLLQNGTVKEMTAAEFAAAPKAGGKK